jgi:hypothetical protein
VFNSLRSRIRQVFLLGCVSGAALLVLAVGQASAATYPSGGSTFTGSAEGWTGKTECPDIYKVLNLVPGLLCEGSAGYVGTAGNPAGSFEGKAAITLNLLNAFNAEEIATSPAFTATAGGSGTLRLDRQFAPEGLLELAPKVEYTAYLVDRSAGSSKQKAIAENIEAASPFTTKSGGVTLIAGHTYVIEITAKIGSSVAGLSNLFEILGSTSFRFDNVSVTGPGGENGPTPNPPGCTGNCNGENGNNGENGGNGASGGAGGVSAARLESLMQSSLIGPAVLQGNRLTVTAKCPAKVNATCSLSLWGMLSKKKAATGQSRAHVKKGKKRKFVLKVKPAARKSLKTKKKLLFKEGAQAGKSKVTVYKTLKLVHKK